MYADGLLKNTPTKDNKYFVNQKLEHVDDISFRELFGGVNFYKIRYISS
jgi:TfoX/Sxy family transcriptional regulator of competence genes